MTSFEDVFKELQQKYISESSKKTDELDRLFAVYCESPSSENLAEFIRAVHSLKGSGKSFGFPQITWVASDIEDFLRKIASGKIVFDEPVKKIIAEAMQVFSEAFKTAKEGESFIEDNYPVMQQIKNIVSEKAADTEQGVPTIYFAETVKNDILDFIPLLEAYGYRLIELKSSRVPEKVVVITDNQSLPDAICKKNKIIFLSESSEEFHDENVLVLKKPFNFEEMLAIMADAFGDKK